METQGGAARSGQRRSAESRKTLVSARAPVAQDSGKITVSMT